MTPLYSLTVALFLTISLMPLMMRISARLGMLDNPGSERKVHSMPTPRTGGLAIILGVSIPLFFLQQLEGYLVQLYLGCAVIILFGLLDDKVELGYKWKLFGQAIAAAIVMSGGVVFHQFPFMGLSEAPVWLSYPFTFFFLVGVVNGLNFSDGLDGLAAGISIMALLIIFALALQSGNADLALISLTVVGGLLGFLRYNTFPATIFMGDSGSQFIGFVIACLSICVTQSELSAYSVVLPILILGIPIMDILQVIPVRIKKKLPLPGPDKEHFHHQLGKLGFRHVEVVVIIYLLQAVLMGGTFLLRYEGDLQVALFYSSFVISILCGLYIGNVRGWRFHSVDSSAVKRERRNSRLRQWNWYFYNSPRLIAALLGAFFVAVGWHLRSSLSGTSLILILGISLAIGLLILFSKQSAIFSRVALYSACAYFGYRIPVADIGGWVELCIIGYLAILLICLMLAIRMTRKKDFSLSTQDLLILLILILTPLLPFHILDQYPVAIIAIVVAILMYTSELVINRGTRLVAFSSACAIAGLLMPLISAG